MRSNYWDAWKGVAILAVVAIHATGESGKFPAESFNWYFGLVFRQIINFAVPLFLALAGFFAARGSTSFSLHYYHSRLGHVLPPYLFWTVIFVLLKHPSDFFSPGALSKDIFLGTGIGIGYFIVVLAQFIFITPFILKIKKDWQHILIMAAIFAGSMFITYEIRINQAESTWAQFPMNALPFFVWYPFYHLGIYVAQLNSADNDALSYRSRTMFSLFLLFTIAAVIEGVYLAHQGFFSFGASQIKFSSFMASISLFMFAVSYFKKGQVSTNNTYVVWLGKNSYPIYLTHLLFLPLTGSILKTIPFVYSAQPLFIFINTTLTLAACVILIRFVSFAIPDVVQKKYLGI
ncbi:acyltransferase [Methylobacter svalbardensis]|uniref:acyltransferase n=1 Tax=Methylobacter svalbardensis TaxID=3080016 RepID=UPI0030EE32D7